MDKILSSFDLISHPDRTLDDHLKGCNEASKLQLALKYINEVNFFPKDDIEKMRHLLVYFHDFGKATDYFACRIIEAMEQELASPKYESLSWQKIHAFSKKVEPYVQQIKVSGRWRDAKSELYKDKRLSGHARLGAYFVLSVFKHDDLILRFILLKVILKHHGNLTNFWYDKNNNKQIQLDPHEAERMERQIEKLDFNLYQKILDKQHLQINKSDWSAIKSLVMDEDLLNREELKFNKRKDIRYFFLQHYLFSLLLSADKGDVKLPTEVSKETFIKENRLFPLPLIDFYKNSLFKNSRLTELDQKREEAYQLVADHARVHSDQHFFSITLPTGMGKTFTAYNAAIILQNEFARTAAGKKPRIIYCLPFTSIIDQNASILERIIDVGKALDGGLKSDWLSKNHYLSNHNETYDENELENQEPEYLTEGWEHEIIVTTFVQLLESIFTNKNSALRKFHNMTNAVIVLDEVQNIAPKYYEAIEVVFKKMAHYFNTKFLFVTATQPFLFANQSSIIELTGSQTESYFRQLDRIVLDQTLLKDNHYSSIAPEVFLEILKNDIQSNPDKSFLIICNTIAQSRWLAAELESVFPDAEHIYLSSSLIPPVRRWNIRRIKRSTKRKIVVSTQVVEAGVDIDLDVVYRDFAPVDSINQSAGRCNRNALKGAGTVKLFNLGKHKRIYDATLMDITTKALDRFPNTIPESDLYDLNLFYAAQVRANVAANNTVSQKLIEAMGLLNLETIESDFKLIEEDDRNYNVFLPCSASARNAWRQYLKIKEILNPYEKKAAMKKHKAVLLQYVTRFPKNKYKPDRINDFLVYEENWREWYDLSRGFIINQKDDHTKVF